MELAPLMKTGNKVKLSARPREQNRDTETSSLRLLDTCAASGRAQEAARQTILGHRTDAEIASAISKRSLHGAAEKTSPKQLF